LIAFTRAGNLAPDKRMPASITGFGGLSNKLDEKLSYWRQESEQKTGHENFVRDF
jgi:hypothetical protein